MGIKTYFQKKRAFNKIIKDIKSIKIQGARNVAKSALIAYSLFPSEKSRKKLLKTRPTEPMMEHVLNLAVKEDTKEILEHFDKAQKNINKFVNKLIKNNTILFTHCHSTNVIEAFLYAKSKGKKFEVYNFETRPIFQGRKTAQDLIKANIPVTLFLDSGISLALSKKKKNSIIFIGADALVKDGVINKIGSGLIARIAMQEKIPVYVVADSWKWSFKKVPIEQRELNEIWDRAPKKIKIQNPAFEFVEKKYLRGIITEKGIMNYNEFVRKMKK